MVLVFFLVGAVVVVVDRAEVPKEADHGGKVNDGADTFSEELRTGLTFGSASFPLVNVITLSSEFDSVPEAGIDTIAGVDNGEGLSV